MKKGLNIAFRILILVYLVVSLSFTADKKSELLCNDLHIQMKDTLDAGFLKKTDVENLILQEESEILGYPVGRINTRKIEKKLRSLPYIKSAEIYYDLEGILFVDVVQRKPVARVITRSGESFYLDEEGYLFRPRGVFTPHILIGNGYFPVSRELAKAGNLSELSDKKEFSKWNDFLNLSCFIERNEFWKSQIVQVFLNSKGEFELIPRVGAHQIIFGEAKEIPEKFEKLMTLYKDGLDYEGWNNYGKINLKYKNQVICTKR